MPDQEQIVKKTIVDYLKNPTLKKALTAGVIAFLGALLNDLKTVA